MSKKLAKIYVQYFGNSMTSGEGSCITHCYGMEDREKLRFRCMGQEPLQRDKWLGCCGFILVLQDNQNSFKSK